MTGDLFGGVAEAGAAEEWLAPGAVVLRAHAESRSAAILAALGRITEESPFRNMITPGGFRMSVAMSNCGGYGWVTDRTGYRYDPIDPETGNRWPGMPPLFASLATAAAARAGFPGFEPDACLINRYDPGARMSLHQDRNERDFGQPIVSVSLGLPATFLFGGMTRGDKAARVRLAHGDVMVWGGPARLRYHGVLPLKDGDHPAVGPHRINLTFRRAT